MEGGIKKFATRKESVLEQCLNRNAKAENTKVVKDLCSIITNIGIYKPVRPLQIIRSEKIVGNIVQVLVDD